MVKHGPFSVELVNAESHLAFPEHCGPESQFYAEVEPHVEYFIRVQVNIPEGQVYMCHYQVDGKNLGFVSYIRDKEAFLEGVWKMVGEEETIHAIKVKPLSCYGDAEVSIGQVEVAFWTAVDMRTLTTQNVKGDDELGDDADVRSCSAVNSSLALGATSVTVASLPGPEIDFERGRLLQTIRLHYCTAVGLIHAGVLPKPEFWEYHRMRFKALATAPTTEISRLAVIQPGHMTMQIRSPLGDLLEEKTCDLFDLTHVVDDDDNDESVPVQDDR